MERCTMCRMQKPDVAEVDATYRISLCDRCAERLLDQIAERVARNNAELETWND